MLALALVALITTLGVMTVTVLADSGLRWWSAFRHLRRVLKITAQPAMPELRPAQRAGVQTARIRPTPCGVAVNRARGCAAA